METFPATHRVLVRHALLNAHRRPDALALVDLTGDAPRSRCWGQLAAHIAATAALLRDAGATAGDTVGVLCGSGLEWVVATCAVHWAEMVDVPIDPARGSAAASRCFAQAGCRHVLVRDVEHAASLQNGFATIAPACPSQCEPLQNCQVEEADQRLRRVDPHWRSTVMFTSGTTADPKGVVLTHGNLSSNAAGKLRAVPQSESEVRMSVVPLAHGYGRTCDFGTWLLSGGTLAICSPAAMLQWLPRIRPHLMNAVPLLIDRLLDAAKSSSWQATSGGRLRAVGCGGASLGEERFDLLRFFGVSVIHGYGTTETSPVICSTRVGDERRGTVGPPIEGVQVRVEADGQLACRGPNVCSGYLDDAVAAGRRTADGWWRTSDLATIHSDGHVTILGRTDDVLVLPSGHKLHPAAIEARLSAAPGIRHAMLAVINDQLTVAVDAEDPWCADARALLRRITDQLSDLPRWQVPRRVVVFPRHLSHAKGELNHKGAIRRTAIRGNFPALLRDA